MMTAPGSHPAMPGFCAARLAPSLEEQVRDPQPQPPSGGASVFPAAQADARMEQDLARSSA